MMKVFKTAAFLAVMQIFVFLGMVGGVSLLATPAVAEDCAPGVNCNDPIAVGKGEPIPVHKVDYCFIGQADKQYEIVPCDSERAVHLSPKGRPVVCFMGSDGKPHWDRQDLVWKGRKFINQCVAGCDTADPDWQPNWQ